MKTSYLSSAIGQLEYYKQLGEQTFAQLTDEHLFWQYNNESNSVATIVKHLAGNMLSRWTDFLTTDGEKDWRNRDNEFVNEISTRTEMLAMWDKGWQVLLATLEGLSKDDLERIIYIRDEAHTVIEAINRQLAHYPYHIGQIVYIGKQLADGWQSLSIPRGGSQSFNKKQLRRDKL